MNSSEEGDKFTDKFKRKLLKDLAANYDQVRRCYCAHKDRIYSVQENLKYNKRMIILWRMMIILLVLFLIFLAFLSGLEIGFRLSNLQYGRRPCISTIPFWTAADCEVAF